MVALLSNTTYMRPELILSKADAKSTRNE